MSPRLVRVAFAWFCLWLVVTIGLYAIFGRCLAAKITCGLWLGPFGVAYAMCGVLLVCAFFWDMGSAFVAWFAEPWRKRSQ